MVSGIWNAIAIIVGLMILIPLLILVVAIVVALLFEFLESIASFIKRIVDRFNQNN